MMKVSNEFSRFAEAYASYSIIQDKVADKLMSAMTDRPKVLLDIGCGRGAITKRIHWEMERLIAVDFAPRMLELHPKGAQIECIFGDFDDPALYQRFGCVDFDRIVSASALQWSPDLAHTFGLIRSLNAPVSLAIFTAGTFETLLKTASLPPMLQHADTVASMARSHFDASFETVHYSLAFENVREMFRYIKRSGVSGNRNALSYIKTKQLMSAYPLDYLEFEVLFIRN